MMLRAAPTCTTVVLAWLQAVAYSVAALPACTNAGPGVMVVVNALDEQGNRSSYFSWQQCATQQSETTETFNETKHAGNVIRLCV